jgi:hypothetical protein
MVTLGSADHRKRKSGAQIPGGAMICSSLRSTAPSCSETSVIQGCITKPGFDMPSNRRLAAASTSGE